MNKILISLKQLHSTLNSKYKRKFYFLILLMLINAFLEIISLGSIIPFISSILDPNFFERNYIGIKLANYFPNYSYQNLIIIILFFFSFVVTISGLFKTFLLWITTKFNAEVGISLSNKVYNKLLFFSYKDFISKNSNKIISDVANKITTVIFFIIFPLLLLLTALIQLIGIFAFLMTINFYFIFSILIFFLASYYLTFKIVRQKLLRNSKSIADQEVSLVRQIQEGFGAKKIIMINNLQSFFFENFKMSNTSLRNSQASNAFLNMLPKYIIETFAIIILSLIIYLLLFKNILNQTNGQTIALIGLLGFSAQKIMPLIQQTYTSVARIFGAYDSLASINKILSMRSISYNKINKNKKIEFNNHISFKDINFSYNSENTLKNINFNINKGEKIGIVGTTGSGKSTLVDIISGLLKPDKGDFKIDNRNLTPDNVNLWQKNISIVPQSIYLNDDTIQNNIAYSVKKNTIDKKLLENSIKKAGLGGLIKSKLNGINTKVGERGIILSGGQRQKIAIARAFYRKASIIILDEATSSLDNKTEQEIIDVLKKIDKKITLIIISHKVETLKFCDRIMEIEKGKIKFFDKYQKLIKLSYSFRKLIYQFNEK